MAAYVFDYVTIHVFGLGAHLVVKVGTVEARLVDTGVGHAEVFLYVVLHLGGSRGRKGDYGTRRYLVDDRTYLAVFGAEIVSPFRDTVGFVDGVERNRHPFQEIDIVLLGKAFGSYIQQFGAAVEYIFLDLVDRTLVERGVEEMGYGVVAAELPHGIHLVLHQGYKRGYDDGGPRQHQGRQLVAEALAPACGHEDKDVVT